MGFSVAASLGSHVMLRGTHEAARIKCPSFCRTEKSSVGFKHLKHNKAIQRGVFLCKQESIEFDERKSPNEVTPSLYIYHLLLTLKS